MIMNTLKKLIKNENIDIKIDDNIIEKHYDNNVIKNEKIDIKLYDNIIDKHYDNTVIKNHYVNNEIENKYNNIIKNQNNIVKINQLLHKIEVSKNDVSSRLFIVSEAYDKYLYEYYIISLIILILSSIITFIEAFRLTILELNENKKGLNYVSLTLNIFSLISGTIITILTSITRFKNYREILEGLKESQAKLVLYKNKYIKQKNIIYFHHINDIIKDKEIIYISDKISQYEKAIKSINYFQFIRNKDIITYNKNKAKFDLSIFKIKKNAQNDFELISKIKDYEYNKINHKNTVLNKELEINNKIIIDELNYEYKKFKKDYKNRTNNI